MTGSLLRTAATRIVFAPAWSGDWIAVSWYQLSPGVGGNVTSRPMPFTVMRICRGSKPVCAYRALADRVAASGATAVFLGGLIDTNAARVIRDLRARLSDRVDLLAPDGLTPLPLLLRRAGPAAVGTYVSLTGIVTDRVPPAGQRFARTQAGVEVEPSAVYTAQATEVLLDAIGRSDGTRSSIVEELFRTRVSGGLLGTFEFDENGDVSESPVTILQVRPRDPSASTGGIEGGAVVRIVRPSPGLVASED